jgi:hypothetical protein
MRKGAESVNIREIIERNIIDEKIGLLDVPKEVIDAVEKVFADVKSGVSKEQVPSDIAEIFSHYTKINIIPWQEKGVCSPVMITFCYDKDDFDGRIMDSLDHAVMHCPNICEYIFFLTTQWDSRAVNKLVGYIEAVRKTGVTLSFIYITPKGFAVMPI